uniref:Uncharacterized protein n=1 Tax=Lepeophtheirus salmonis TaxID=72036 RepID=A0A0K2UUF0_LEPSM
MFNHGLRSLQEKKIYITYFDLNDNS